MPRSLTFNPFSSNFDTISTVAVAAVGSSPNAQGASITSVGQVLTLQPADATNPGVMTASAQSLGGAKTFLGLILADGGIDVTATGGTDTLSIGTTNAEIINIGNSGAAINLYGTTFYQDVTNLQVTDKNITVNVGGAAASGFGAGIEVEENAVITGSVLVSSDRNSWELKAPNTAGSAVITPGAGGIVINQSSHDAVTLAAVGSSPNANGASLSGQVLNLQPANSLNPGVVSTTTQTFAGDKTFTGAISASNFTGSSSGTNTGDVTLAAVGSSPNGNGATLTGQILNLQPADATSPGVVSTTTQSFAGAKTFTGNVNIDGATRLATSLTGPLKAASGVVSAAAINLASAEVTGTLGETNGGTGIATYTTGDTVYASASNTLSKLAIGSPGDVLTVAGGIPSWAAPAASVNNTSYLLENLGLQTSVGSSALTIALKQADGSTNPSSGTSAVKIGFRSATSANGNYNIRSVTSSLSITVSSGSTLGHADGRAQYIWVYALDNAGTVELAVTSTRYDDGSIVSTTAEGGAGAADSNRTIYSTTARSNVPIRLIGRLLSTQTTAGTWAANMSEVSLPLAIKAGDPIVAVYASSSTASASTATPIVYNGFGADTHNAFSSSTTFTAPRTGYYRIYGSAYTGGAFTLRVYVNGSFNYQGTLGSASEVATLNGILVLNAGDAVDLRPDSSVTMANTNTTAFFMINSIG